MLLVKMKDELSADISSSYILLSSTVGVLMIIEFLIPFFFFNYSVNLFLFGVGWILIVLGFWLVSHSISLLRKKGGIDKSDSIGEITSLVTTGFYGIVRHPMYIGMMIFSLALCLTTQYLTSALISLIVIALSVRLMLEEENLNKLKFGESYLEYMKNVPRLNIYISLKREYHARKQPR